MAMGKLSADIASGYPYPRPKNCTRTYTRYPQRIANRIHIRYPRVTDIRGYIRLSNNKTSDIRYPRVTDIRGYIRLSTNKTSELFKG
jgi:hypothetical protein